MENVDDAIIASLQWNDDLENYHRNKSIFDVESDEENEAISASNSENENPSNDLEVDQSCCDSLVDDFLSDKICASVEDNTVLLTDKNIKMVLSKNDLLLWMNVSFDETVETPMVE